MGNLKASTDRDDLFTAWVERIADDFDGEMIDFEMMVMLLLTDWRRFMDKMTEQQQEGESGGQSQTPGGP